MSEIKSIGKCPVCKIGDMIESDKAWSCNYFKSVEDNCVFKIFRNYFDRELEEKQAVELIEDLKTSNAMLFKSKGGNDFEAFLYVNKENSSVQVEFYNENQTNKTLEEKCKLCGLDIVDTKNAFICEGYFQGKCKLYIPKYVASHKVTSEEVTLLIDGQKTDFIHDFISKKGSEFSGRLYLGEDFSVKIYYTITQCPCCGIGQLKFSTRTFYCSNKDEGKGCSFFLWKETQGANIDEQTLIKLCSKLGEKIVLKNGKEAFLDPESFELKIM